MALSPLGLSFVVADVLLRRLLLPFVLLSAVIFRYNLFSFVYLLLFIVSLLLPGPRLKSQKASNVVFFGILLVFSALASLGQSFFQITLATDYSLSSCEGDESTWRQVGFVQFDIPAVDVVRLLLPDVVVFLATLLTLCVNVRVITLKSSTREEVEERGEESVTMTTRGDDHQQGESQRPRGVSGSELEDPSREVAPPFDKTVQCYWRIPKFFVYCLELAIFVTLGLSGVAVPSLISFTYYAVFLLVLIIWSVHLRLGALVRVIRAILVIYSALHLLLLDLYQFSSAQSHIEIEPANTTQSLLARLFGLTPLIFTDCDRPAELLLTPDQSYISYLSPVFILALLWVLATDLRMWLFTPKLLWRKHAVYFLPIFDSRPSSSVFCIMNQGTPRQKLWSSYGAIQHEDSRIKASPATLSTDLSSPSPAESLDIDEAVTVVPPRRRRLRKMSFKDIWHKIQHVGVVLWGVCLSVSYIFAIVCMMLWSVLYPSWPSLVFLLWSCVIWLIPRVNPKNSLFFTSPLLVLYALVLLILQYVYSLDLNEDELSRNFDLITECSSATLVGCKSWVLLAKTLLTVVFFAAFHESIRIFKKSAKQWIRKRSPQQHHTDDGEIPLTQVHNQEATDSEDSEVKSDASTARTKIYNSVYRLLCSYWILVVIGAFLLIMLTGEPSLLKSVYMVFFFLFLVTYQVTENFWFYLSFPVWWLLVVYSALELVLVYTYQFDVVSNGWLRLYNRTHLENDSISAEELYDSIGLRKYDINALRNLLVSLIPPAIFIAVMAMQLRYFRPLKVSASTTSHESGLSALDLKNLLPSTLRNRVNQWEGQNNEEDQLNGNEDESTHTAGPNPTDERTKLSGVGRQRTMSSSSESKAFFCYRVSTYIFQKSREIIVGLYHLFWRFLELHMHKIIALVLFASTLTQISAIYLLLLLSIVIILPLPYFNPLSYPLITLYLGIISTLKMLYQVPLLRENYFNFTESSTCNATIMTTPGLVYNETYSPRTGSANWIGLHKTNDFASYIWLPIITSLLLSLWFAARRYQAHYYHSKGTRIEPYETGSLFLSVTRQDAETSVISAVKYLINHFFEMYGVEVCWSMLAITVAVRVDVYGPLYGIILGLLLFTPRRVLAPVWVIVLLVHGVLLLIQYFFLLGGPPGFCLARGGTNVYAWSNLTPPALKKWLFLTDDVHQVLDKNLLYADFIFYILVCLQIHYFRGNPLRKGTRDQVNGALHNFLQLQHFLDYIKYIVIQYSFWVSLFLMFFTAASRVSLFGLLYLLVGFFFLYRGMDMLRDKQHTRHYSWAILRMVTLTILFIRVSLQVIDCPQLVDWKAEGDDKIDCILVLLFNGACIKQRYYGSPDVACSSGPNSVGLWVDALNFVVITLQIIIFDTQFSEIVRVDVLRKQKNAKSFRDVFDYKVTEIEEVNQEKMERDLQELKERAAELKLTENRIDHILYAGVEVPEDIAVRRLHKRRDTTTSESDAYFGIDDSDSVAGDVPKSKVSSKEDEDKHEEKKALVKAWVQFVSFLNQVLDMFINWLESTSYLYRTVVSELNREASSSPDPGLESIPLATEHVGSYGTIETRRPDDEPDGDESQPAKPQPMTTTTVEVHDEQSRRPSEGSYSAAVSEGNVLKDEEMTSSHGATRSPGAGGAVTFDTRGDVLLEELHVAPTEEEERDIREFEEELEDKAKKYSYKFRRLIVALYYTFLAHSEYVVYFFIILNVILNGSLLSLVYVVLLFSWGLLSIPWPSKRFWLILIFYSMIVLMVKYGFQFQDISYWDNFDSRSGLYPPRLIGILFRENFFTNAAWDMLLLIALLIHRGLLKEYGLWTTRSVITTKNFFQVVWNDFKGFFKRILSPVITQGAKDYYVPMLFFDILCFITIILGVSSFGVGFSSGGSDIEAVAAVADFVRSNYIPLPFIVLLLLQFISMLVDRAIYIRHSLIGKVIFYFILLVGWHVWLFFFLPSTVVTGRPFSENSAAQCIYFFKCCYFIVSALQIVAGYPTRIFGYFLAKAYNTVSWLAFLGYRLIPLLPELREVMDWAFTDTSLSLINWFKVQEIYAQLYLVEVQRRREANSPRQLGAKQTWLIKIVLGFTVILALVLLLWLPLLVISIIGTTNKPNPPMQVGIQVTLGGSQPLLQIDVQEQNITQLNNMQYSEFLRKTVQDPTLIPVIQREFGSVDFSQVVFPGGSTSLWTVSPDARNRLLDRLLEVQENPNITIPIEFSWTITRNPSSGIALETVSGRSRRDLKYSTDNSTIDDFIESLLDTEANINVSLPNLYPSIVLAPANDISRNYSQFTGLLDSSVVNVSCSLLLNKTMGSTDEWWSLFQNPSPGPIIPFDGQGGLELIIYSERIAPQVFSAIVGFGILGLYGSVVIVIGQLIRGYISNLPSRLIVDEILNPEPLLKLCNDIFLVREYKEFRLEEMLVGKLFFIFRSPERIVKLTENTNYKLKQD